MIYFPQEITFPLKAEYERMNETLEGLKDNVNLDRKEIKDLGDDDDTPGRPPGGGGGDDGLGDDRPPPDPGEEDPDLADIEFSEDEKPDERDRGDDYDPIDAIGDKILERAEREASDMMPPLAPSATPPPGISDDRRSLDEVGPSGRLIPKGDSEEPGEIIKILKEKKLAPKDMEHWGSGAKGDGKIYLNDVGAACNIDNFLHADPFTSILQKNGRRWARQRRKQHTRKTSETKLDLPRRNGRKPRWERK